MTADHKNSLLFAHVLTKPIQMQLSKKEKNFSEFFSAFLKYILNFEYFQTKNDSLCQRISEHTIWERRG